MKCPICDNQKTKVIDSRVSEKNTRRRRMCETCGFRFTTYEMYESKPIVVIKKDGSTEIFDKNKIMSGLIKSTYKRPVTPAQLDELVKDIENELLDKMVYEVNSLTVGEMVMDRLKKLDEVSYVRFASVYREFKDINTFLAVIRQLKNE